MNRLMILLLMVANIYAARILFDFTKDEDAGNADWVIDDNWPVPQPTWPSSPTDWKGAISSWGYQLKIQYQDTVHTLHNYPLTYGDTSNPYDLSRYDVFIVPEPQDTFTMAERNAILNFIANGGGLFVVADHNGSDRNHNGWDSPKIWNKFGTLQYFGFHFQVSGESYNSISTTSYNLNDISALYDILHGPEGDVMALAFHSGDVMQINTSYNSYVKTVIYYPNNTHYGMCVVSRYGSGKVAAIGDSSPCDDSTGNAGNNLYNGWGEATDSILFINLTRWLVPTSEVRENTHKLIINRNGYSKGRIFFDILGRRYKDKFLNRGIFFITTQKKGKTTILRIR